MCWRDDIVTRRKCVRCGQIYYGSLGHAGCPGYPKKEPIVKQKNTKNKKPNSKK
jgi:hypothetical protein